MVKDQSQSNAHENGIYVYSSSGGWDRASDFDSSSEVVAGDFVFVTEGGNNGSHGFVMITTGTITLGTTNITWTQFSGVGQVTAGEGIDITDNTISCEDATDTNKGIASFSTDNFDVSSGVVTIKNNGVSNDELAGGIVKTKLANYSVSFGGISLELGETDATPAFDLSDATNYPTSSLSGNINLTSQVSGTLPVANGGTGLTDISTLLNSNNTIFKTISVSGQSDIVADSATDTLTLVGAGGATITTDDSNDTITITTDTQLTEEQVQDMVGAMFSSNTETGITATYEDGDGTIDLVVGTLNQDTTGTASKVVVSDSTANTDFPIVFNDESNALLDDTGSLTYNPSTGILTSSSFSGALGNITGIVSTLSTLQNVRSITDIVRDEPWVPLGSSIVQGSTENVNFGYEISLSSNGNILEI